MSGENEVLLWPPPTEDEDASENGVLSSTAPVDTETIDLFEVINAPGKEDYEVTKAPGGGLEIHAGKIIFDSSKYPTCSRDVQRQIVSDLQRSYARTSKGRELAVKEWADENQNRGILRLRLRCKKAKCKLQFQVNWETTQQHWFITRQCENLVHTCPLPKPGKTSPKTTFSTGNQSKTANGCASKKRKSPATTRRKLSNGNTTNRFETASHNPHDPSTSNTNHDRASVVTVVSAPMPVYAPSPPVTLSSPPPLVAHVQSYAPLPATAATDFGPLAHTPAQPVAAMTPLPHPFQMQKHQQPPTLTAVAQPLVHAPGVPVSTHVPASTSPPSMDDPAMVVTDTDQAEADLLAADLREWIPPEISSSCPPALADSEHPAIVPPHISIYDAAAMAMQQHHYHPLSVDPTPAAHQPQQLPSYLPPCAGQQTRHPPLPYSYVVQTPSHYASATPPPVDLITSLPESMGYSAPPAAPAPVSSILIPAPLIATDPPAPATPTSARPPASVMFEIPSPIPVGSTLPPPRNEAETPTQETQLEQHHHTEPISVHQQPQSHPANYQVHNGSSQQQFPASPRTSTAYLEMNNMSFGANSLAMMSIEGDDMGTVGPTLAKRAAENLEQDGMSILSEADSYMLTIGSINMGSVSSKHWLNGLQQSRAHSSGDPYTSTIGSWYMGGSSHNRPQASFNHNIGNNQPLNDQTMMSLTDSVRNMLSLVAGGGGTTINRETSTAASTGFLAQLHNRTMTSRCSEEAESKGSSNGPSVLSTEMAPADPPTHGILAADFFTPPPNLSPQQTSSP